MKAFAASLVLLAVIASCAVLNCIYIDRTVDKLSELEAAFPYKFSDGELPNSDVIDSAVGIWKKASERIACTSNLKYVNAVTLAIVNVNDYYRHGSGSDYIAARHLLKEALTALRDADSISLISII